jgi:hypothetical protein
VRTSIAALLAAVVLIAGPGASASGVDRLGNPAGAGARPSVRSAGRVSWAGALPDVVSRTRDPRGDQGSGPTYGDCLGAQVNESGTNMIVAQKIDGTFPSTPPGDIATWSWRFDTDLNPNTGYQQYSYIGIEWEILIQDSGSGSWTVNKWSQSTGYLPVPGATILVKHQASGDLVGVRFAASEIGSPTQSNWIAWNGLYPTWSDVAPDSTVAYWHQ